MTTSMNVIYNSVRTFLPVLTQMETIPVHVYLVILTRTVVQI